LRLVSVQDLDAADDGFERVRRADELVEVARVALGAARRQDRARAEERLFGAGAVVREVETQAAEVAPGVGGGGRRVGAEAGEGDGARVRERDEPVRTEPRGLRASRGLQG